MIYFDSIRYTAKVTNVFDPTTEFVSFLSTKLTDWCNKMSGTKAEVVTGIPQWQALSSPPNSSTANCSIQLALYMDDERAGFNRDFYNLFTWDTNNGTPRNWLEKIPKTNGRDSSGRLLSTGGYQLQVATGSSSTFSATNLNRGHQLAVAYCDTPGKEFFAIYDSNIRSTFGYSCVISKVTPRPGLTAGHNQGWAVLQSTQALTWSGPTITFQNSPFQPGFGDWGGGGPIGDSNNDTAPWFMVNPPIGSPTDYWVATGENLARCTKVNGFLSIYEIEDGRQFMYWYNGILVDVTGEI